MKQSHAKIEAGFRGWLGALAALVVLAMWPGSLDPAGDLKFQVLHWATTVLGLGWALYSWRMDVKLRFPRMFGGVLLAFLALYLVATLRSDFFDISFLNFSNFVFLFVLYLLAAQVFHTEAQVRALFWWMCAGMALASVYGLCQWAGFDPFPWQDREGDVYQNLPASFGHPNFAAHTLVLCMVLAGCLLCTHWLSAREAGQPEKPTMVILGGVLALFVLHLLLTGQRGGIVAQIAAGALLGAAWLVGRRFRSPVRGAVVSLGLMSLFGLLLALGAAGLAKIVTGIPVPLDTSILIRYQSYVSAAQMLFDRPILGHGPGVYGITYAQYWTPIEQQWFAQERMLNAHVHNDLMELAIDAGLLAAGLYLTLLVLGMAYGLITAFREGPRSRQVLGYAIAAFFCVFFIDGLFGFNLRVPASASFLFLVAGAFEGLALPPFVPATPNDRRFLAKPWRVAAIFFLPIMLVVQTRHYLSSRDHQLGLEALNAGETQKARQHFAAGVARTPWDWELSRRLGMLAMGGGRLPEAAIHLNSALEKNPYHVLSLLSQAQVRMYLAQQHAQQRPEGIAKTLELFDDALAPAHRALELSPVDPAGLDLLGRITSLKAIALAGDSRPEAREAAQGLWAKAEQYLEQAVQHDPRNKADVYKMLADVRAARGDLHGAEEALTRAIQAAPTRPDLWDGFRDFARTHDRYDRLASTLRAQLRRLERAETPDREALATSHLGLGQVIAEGFQDLDSADAHYREAMTLASWRPDFWARFGQYTLDFDRLPLLKQLLEQYMVSREAPGASPALEQVALVARAYQEGDAALNAISLRLLEMYRERDDRILAGEHLNWVVQVLARQLQQTTDPAPHCEAWACLGILLNSMQQNALAADFLRRAQDCTVAEELRALVAVHLGDALIALGQPDAAMLVLRAASQAFPQNIDVRWAFARGLGQVGLVNDAKTAYEALIKEPWLDPRGRVVLQEELNRLQ